MTDSAKPAPSRKRWVPIVADVTGSSGAVFGFFADRSVRETIESIAVAILLALLFRGFLGEAFIIPTGSMAPGLMGRHIDHWCEQCGHGYQTGASCEDPTTPAEFRRKVVRTYCPACGFRTTLLPAQNPDHRSNQGDRILVNKYIYDFQEPERFDVIVFKSPNNGKMNLIKRLGGLPGENLTLSRGDIYTLEQGGGDWKRTIARKPPDKQLAMLELVDDTAHRPDRLRSVGWPEFWSAESVWEARQEKGRETFVARGARAGETGWMRFRYAIPEPDEWPDFIERGLLPPRMKQFVGRLISDHSSYNEMDARSLTADGRTFVHRNPGYHWVGDLAVEATVRVTDRAGSLSLDLVEGGAHFTCRISLVDGTASFSCSDSTVRFCDADGNPGPAPAGLATPVDNRGFWRITFANCDNRLLLWVNGRIIDSPGSCYHRTERIAPVWSTDDPGDAQPAGIGIEGTDAEVDRIRLFRDVYYISVRGIQLTADQNETGIDAGEIVRIHNTPAAWSTPQGQALFDASLREGPPMFVLGPGQYFPLGDNSSESKDARIWEGPNWFSRDLLIGRAMLVYWPHTRNRPVPYTPNFARMRPIR